MTYLAHINAFETALVDLMKTISDFENRVYAEFWHLWGPDDFPGCLVKLISDEVLPLAEQDEHMLYFGLEIHFRATGDPEADWKSLKLLISKVSDKIGANRTLGTTKAWMSVISADYMYRREESLTFYIGLVSIRVVKPW